MCTRIVQRYWGSEGVQGWYRGTRVQVQYRCTVIVQNYRWPGGYMGQRFRSGTGIMQGYGCSTVVLRECMVIGEQVQNKGTAVVQKYKGKGVLQGIGVQE